jgi:hypothetical protein
MATITGNNGTVSVGGTVLAAVRSFSVEMTRDTIETSVMGQDFRTYVNGMSSYSGTADIYFDPAEFDGGETTFNPTAGLVGGESINVKFYVDYAAGSGNDSVFSGSAIVTGYTVNSSMDGMVEASISFQGSGDVSYTDGTNVAP